MKIMKRRAMMIFMVVLCLVILLGITAAPVFAGGNQGQAKINTAIGLMAGWIAKIGLVVAFFGGIETVLAFASDNAEARIKGLKIMAAGFILYGIVHNINDFIP
ncbi:MAG: hypothetical protein PHC81_07270 [Clostridia bacterium]|nr:hypothetical protein [Clostridia bacterium]